MCLYCNDTGLIEVDNNGRIGRCPICGDAYKVIGDHPILKRPDSTRLKYAAAQSYADELIEAGYENVQVILDT